MSDPDYQPPKTDPRLKGVKFREVPKHNVSTNKILVFTFIPAAFMLFGGLVSGVTIDLFILIALGSVILAFILSIFTAVELAKGKEPIAIVGYWILFVIAHAILLFIAMFIGCGIGAPKF